MKRSRIVVDTNVLIYATIEDSEHHKEAYRIVTKRHIVIPYVVLYEYLWVLLKLTNDVKFTKIKIEELKTFQLLHEDIDTIRTGLEILNKDGAPPTTANDYIILATAMLEGALATYDKRLRKLAERHGVNVIP
jgi:Predicted nucleic acid-binding protein, contains PIN domain